MSDVTPKKQKEHETLVAAGGQLQGECKRQEQVEILTQLAKQEGEILEVSRGEASITLTQRSIEAVFFGNAVPLGITLVTMAFTLTVIVTHGYEPRSALIPMASIGVTGYVITTANSQKDG